LQGGGSITRRWNNSGQSLTKRNADLAIGAYSGNIKSQKPMQGGGSITRRWNNSGQSLTKRNADLAIGGFSGTAKAKKPIKGGGSISRRWNNSGNPLMKKDRGPGTTVATTFQGNVYPRGMNNPNIGLYQGDLKYQKTLKGGGSISRRWNNNANPLMKKDRGEGTVIATTYKGNVFPRGMNNPNIGLYQGEIKSRGSKSKGYPTQEFIGNVTVINKRPPQSKGTEYGLAKKIAGVKIGTSGGTMQTALSKNKDNINIITVRVKERELNASAGTKLGKNTTFSFIKFGNPNVGGLVHKQKRLKVNNNLPKQIDRSQRRNYEAAPGADRGTDWALSFWEFGNPTHMGLSKQNAKAKGKLHPSTGFKYTNTNAIDEKEKVVSVKLLWAKLFKKNAGTPETDKEFSHKLKRDKDERSIWETEEREDWYK
jgi:hypothetical protein